MSLNTALLFILLAGIVVLIIILAYLLFTRWHQRTLQGPNTRETSSSISTSGISFTVAQRFQQLRDFINSIPPFSPSGLAICSNKSKHCDTSAVPAVKSQVPKPPSLWQLPPLAKLERRWEARKTSASLDMVTPVKTDDFLMRPRMLPSAIPSPEPSKDDLTQSIDDFSTLKSMTMSIDQSQFTSTPTPSS